MDEKIERLLYTTKDGTWYWETGYAADKLELDDEDIDFDRIPEIRKLLTKPVALGQSFMSRLKRRWF